MSRTPDRRRECALASCRAWFVTPHDGTWPAAYCTALCHQTAKRARSTAPRAKARAISPASTRQRVAVMEHGCLVCAHPSVDAAHVWPRGMGGCDDPACVVPLCRTHHRAWDTGHLDLLPFLVKRNVPQLQHALEHANGNLIALLERVTSQRWAPVEETRRAA